MKIIIRLIAFVLVVLTAESSIAKTYQTISPGSWSSTAVWFGGVVPPYSTADTFLIHHAIVLDTTLTLNAPAFFHIDSAGGICGHQKVQVNAGASIIESGILELDTLIITGGVVNCVIPGLLILTHNGYLSNGGYLSVTCSLSVGPWFNCHLPEYSFTALEEVESLNPLIVFPDPATDVLDFTARHNEKFIIISDVRGKIVLRARFNSSDCKINITQFSNGLYFFSLLDDNDLKVTSGKFVVRK